MLLVNFIMIYVIHKISVLLKITGILRCFLRSIIDFYFKKIYIFFTTYNEDNIIKDVRNLFRLKKLKKKQMIPQSNT